MNEQHLEINKQWFIDRIGKRIYRDRNTCECKTCDCVSTEGLTVSDEQHANYLHMVSCDMNIGYRDEK